MAPGILFFILLCSLANANTQKAYTFDQERGETHAYDSSCYTQNDITTHQVNGTQNIMENLFNEKLSLNPVTDVSKFGLEFHYNCDSHDLNTFFQLIQKFTCQNFATFRLS